MRWYYEKKEIRNAPSIQSGMDVETESRYRREGARFVIDIGSNMNLSLTTMATGVVYYHRFYMFHRFQDFSRYPTALACLFLAGKVEETPKKCKDMLKVARELLADDKFAQFGIEARNASEEVMTLERIILQTIKFDLHVEHPYTFLLKYAKCLKGDKGRLQKMVQMAWTFVNDSLCTTLCLQWEPEIVAIALMHLAGKLSKFEVMDWNGRTSDHFRWWDMFVEDMTIELLEDICHQVLDLYSQTQNQAPSESPPPSMMGGIGGGMTPGSGPRPSYNSSTPLPSHPQSAQGSPKNNTPTHQGVSSRTSTPIAIMPPMPSAPPLPTSFPPGGGSAPSVLPPQTYSFPPGHLPPMPMGLPPFVGSHAPPVPPGYPPPSSNAPGSQPPIPPPSFPPPPPQGQMYYPPPLPPSTRAYQPPLPPQ